jgi:hypothetical protein
MKVYDYGVFFEDGHKESFYLEYGPDKEAGDSDDDRFIYDYKNNKHMQRFNEETDGNAFAMFETLDAEHSFGFIIVNPPRELDE